MRSKYGRSSLIVFESKRIQAIRSCGSDYVEFHGIIQECVCSPLIYQKREKRLIGYPEMLYVCIWSSKGWLCTKRIVPLCEICEEVKNKKSRRPTQMCRRVR